MDEMETKNLAIEERAKAISSKTPIAWEDRYEVIRHPTTNAHSKEYFREQAAKELHLEAAKEIAGLR